jgi:hypothetical protein
MRKHERSFVVEINLVSGNSKTLNENKTTHRKVQTNINYSYDSNGNLINESKTLGITANLYDEFNDISE